MGIFKKRIAEADLGKRHFDGEPRKNWLYWAYSAITAAIYGWIIYLVFSSRASASNLWQSLVFAAKSFAYFALKIYDKDPTLPATAFDSFDWSLNSSPIGMSWEAVGNVFRSWGWLLINPRYLLSNLTNSAQILLNITRIVFIIALLALPVFLLFRDYFKTDEQINKAAPKFKSKAKAEKAAKRRGSCWSVAQKGNRWALVIHRRATDETAALLFWEKTLGFVNKYAFDFALGYFRFVFGYWSQPDPRRNRVYISRRPWVWKIALILLGYYFNIYAALIDFFGYYYLFFASFSPIVLGKWFATGFVLFWPLLTAFLPIAWVAFFYFLFDRIRSILAKRKERREKAKNRKAAKRCGVSVIDDGPPGSHKSTALCMDGRDAEEELREDCFDWLQRAYTCFPRFPWSIFYDFENKEIHELDSEIRNSAQAAEWADMVNQNMPTFFPHFAKMMDSADALYFDGAEVFELVEVMEQAAKAYFFYSTKKPLVCSSFPMLVECDVSSESSILPQYAHKSLKTDFAAYPEKRQFSFIANEDSWKTIRPIDGKGNAKGDLEGIVWLIDEINKIYPNKMDKMSGWRIEDGIKDSWSLWRHYTCIWSNPTINFGVVTQRYGDLPVNITSRIEAEKCVTAASDVKSFLFMWSYTRWAQEAYLKFYRWFDEKYKGARNDESLLHHWAALLYAPVSRRYWKRRKQFDYFKEAVHVSYHASESAAVSRDYVRTMIVCDCYGGWFKTDVQKDHVNKERIASGHCFMDAGQWTSFYPDDAQEEARNTYEGRDVEKLASCKDGSKPEKGGFNL